MQCFRFVTCFSSTKIIQKLRKVLRIIHNETEDQIYEALVGLFEL